MLDSNLHFTCMHTLFAVHGNYLVDKPQVVLVTMVTCGISASQADAWGILRDVAVT